ncbi:T9SS type A sorting domain-containing protein [Dyadobacter alkalitolerans]|uniref:T9SS type A sorting domain-containing protein n=1 Tax=Dyadobacter alkalitolerans TaxID=492736 RepID=UPI00040F9672|nr:T9SS type A sorting domain-containing protein [Dyadobacter alkalitolerans]
MNVSIYNAEGHLERLEHVSQSNSNSIPVSALQHGVYILQVEDVVNKSIKAVRFMKE